MADEKDTALADLLGSFSSIDEALSAVDRVLSGHPPAPAIITRKRGSNQISESRTRDLIEAAFEAETRDAKEAGTLGFLPRVLVQTCLPYRDPKVEVYKRKNGGVTLTLFSPEGVPFGTVPRFMVSWLATQAVKKQSPVISLGRSQNEFLENLGMRPSDGRDAKRLHMQSTRFFSTVLNVKVDKPGAGVGLKNVLLASEAYLAWNPKQADQPGLWDSTLTLTDEFFRECIEHPIPVDMRVLHALSSSPMAMDVYAWLTYRIAICTRESTIPWDYLQLQFGTKEGTRLTHFRQDFERALQQVLVFWKPAISVDRLDGLTVFPGLPHISK